MKKQLWVLAALFCLPWAAAAPNQDFSNIVQTFTRQRGMVFRGVSQIGSDGKFDSQSWTYSFAAEKNCTADCDMTVTFAYTKPGQSCVWKAGLFGELPLRIQGRPALFSSPLLSDPASKVRDVLYADDGQGGCYAVSYGFAGSKFNDAESLMNILLGK